MIVYNQQVIGAPNYYYYHFDQFDGQGNDFTFIDSPQDFSKVPEEIFQQNPVYLEVEEPNRFFSNVEWFNHFKYDYKFSKVFSICPYTTEWRNKIENTNITHSFLPVDDPKINNDKIYDIIFAGHIFQGEIENRLYDIKDFNYRVVSNSDHPLTTNKSASHFEKLTLVSQSKISLAHNLLYLTPEHIAQVKIVPHYQSNEAFSRLEEGIVPQIKGRVFEAALCRSLILCQSDPFNVIEKFFQPDEFVYYQRDKLKEKITEILANYQDYLPMIERAYNRALNYTTEAFFHKYLKDL